MESLDFELNAGDLCCVSGPPGCGKTTLLRALCGLHSAGTGSIISRVNTGISSSRLFTDDFSYDREGNPSMEYVEIDTEKEQMDDNITGAMVNSNGDDTLLSLLAKKKTKYCSGAKIPKLPEERETLLGNDISVNTQTTNCLCSNS